MNLMKCPNGHHYDASRFSSCPFCGMEGVNVGPDQTTVPLDVPVSQPGPSVATEPLSTAIPDDDDRTLPVTAECWTVLQKSRHQLLVGSSARKV